MLFGKGIKILVRVDLADPGGELRRAGFEGGDEIQVNGVDSSEEAFGDMTSTLLPVLEFLLGTRKKKNKKKINKGEKSAFGIKKTMKSIPARAGACALYSSFPARLCMSPPRSCIPSPPPWISPTLGWP
jgi:hypothetical protein